MKKPKIARLSSIITNLVRLIHLPQNGSHDTIALVDPTRLRRHSHSLS